MKAHEMDMTEGPLFGKLILFSLPLMASGMLQLLFNACDTIVVGKFVGDEALAAVGSVGSLINLIIGLFFGISVGSNVLVAQFYGAKRKRDVEEVVHTSALVALILGAVLTVFGLIFCETFLRWMGTPDDVIKLSALYLRIYFCGCPFMLLYNFMAAVLRAVGDTKRPLIFLTIAGAINLALNLLLVIVFHMGVEGVAIPTLASQIVSAVLIVITMTKDDGMTHLDIRRIRIVPNKLVRMLQIGVPSGLQGCVFSLSNVLIQSSVNSFGTLVMAGNTAAINLEGFVYQGMNCFYHGALNFTAQNAGAGKDKRILGVFWRSAILVSAMGILLGGGVWLLGPNLIRIYTTTEESIQAGVMRMTFVCLPYFLCGLMEVSSGMVKGLGSSVTPMIVSLTGSCLTRIIWIYTVFRTHHTMETLYVVYPISWILTATAHTVCFIILFIRMKKRWESGRERIEARKKRREKEKKHEKTVLPGRGSENQG